MNPDLSQLRDIHLPAPVSWWPPAPGWWLLAAILLGLIIIGYWLIRRHRINRWRRQALAQLAQLKAGEDATVAAQLSVLLRRVAISRYPQAKVAALTGEAWLTFLDDTLDSGTPFQTGPGRALVTGPYTAEAEIDAPALLSLAERWIKRVKGGAQ